MVLLSLNGTIIKYETLQTILPTVLFPDSLDILLDASDYTVLRLLRSYTKPDYTDFYFPTIPIIRLFELKQTQLIETNTTQKTKS